MATVTGKIKNIRQPTQIVLLGLIKQNLLLILFWDDEAGLYTSTALIFLHQSSNNEVSYYM